MRVSYATAFVPVVLFGIVERLSEIRPQGQQETLTRTQALALLEKRGAFLERDEDEPGMPVTGVDYQGIRDLTDRDLAPPGSAERSADGLPRWHAGQ